MNAFQESAKVIMLGLDLSEDTREEYPWIMGYTRDILARYGRSVRTTHSVTPSEDDTGTQLGIGLNLHLNRLASSWTRDEGLDAMSALYLFAEALDKRHNEPSCGYCGVSCGVYRNAEGWLACDNCGGV